MKRPMSRLQLLGVFLFSFLALRTTCHPRPTASSQATTVDIAQDGHVVGVTSFSGLTSVDRASNTSLGRRDLGFQQFLPIGNGWNMYYSSWPVMALPVREYHIEYCTPADLVARPRVRNDVGGPGVHVRRPDRLVVDVKIRP